MARSLLSENVTPLTWALIIALPLLSFYLPYQKEGIGQVVNPESPPFVGRTPCPGREIKTLPKWTCIVYLAGDNFLDWFTQQNLEELKEAGRGVLQYAPTYDVRTVVLADKMDKGGHLYEVRNGYLLELPVEDINPYLLNHVWAINFNCRF